MRRGSTALLAALAFSSTWCRSPTDVTVRTRSEVDCARRARVAMVVAHDVPSLQGAVPSAFSTRCSPTSEGWNDTGSVVLTPAGNSDDPVAFAVMTRPDGESPETCLDVTQAGKCIVARRQLRFAPHIEIEIPVELRLSCLGVACPPSQTCRKGECVDARLSPTCTSCGESALAASSVPACGDTGGLQQGAPWPMAGYCPTRAGRSGRLGPHTANVLWKFKTGEIASMSPAISATGTIFVGSNDKNVHAVDHTGREVWRATVQNNINDTGFVIGRDGTVYVGCADKKVYAFSEDGKPRWATFVEADVAFTPASGSDGTIFINGLGDRGAPAALFAVRTDGSVKWRNGGPFGISSVAIGLDGSLYVGGTDSALHALRPADGSELWTAPTAPSPTSAAVGGDGTIYVVDQSNLHALAPAGARRWSIPLAARAAGVALAPDDTVYVPLANGTLLAVRSNGTLKWSFDAGAAWGKSATVGGDGTAYVGNTDGSLYAVSSDGALQWKVPTGGPINSQPAIGGDGTLYFVSADSFLYAVGP